MTSKLKFIYTVTENINLCSSVPPPCRIGLKGSEILWAAKEDTINDISDNMDKKLKIQDDS